MVSMWQLQITIITLSSECEKYCLFYHVCCDWKVTNSTMRSIFNHCVGGGGAKTQTHSVYFIVNRTTSLSKTCDDCRDTSIHSKVSIETSPTTSMWHNNCDCQRFCKQVRSFPYY